MATRDWLSLIGGLALVFAVTLQQGSADDATQTDPPEWTTALQGNCSINQNLYCHDYAQCKELTGDRSYCNCPEANTGDGLKNGTGCEIIVYSCAVDRNCHDNGYCNDQQICVCDEGFTGDGKSCDDIDECDIGLPCGPYAYCKNEIGSYQCTCWPKYELIDGNCTFRCFVDHDCAVNAECNGQQICQCTDGYAGDGANTCVDVDECTLPENDCDSNANCINQPGTYECACKNGYVGTGYTCDALPRHCQEIYLNNPGASNGLFEIDPDFEGPAIMFEVNCDFDDGMGLTIVYPTDQPERTPSRGGTKPVNYDVEPEQLKPLVENSDFCSQYWWLKCKANYDLIANVNWEDIDGDVHNSWGTSVDGKCPCGVLGVCVDPASSCNCDGQNTYQEVDEGNIIDKSQLPVMNITFARADTSTDWSIGPLKCGPKASGLPENCHDAKVNFGVDINGPQLVDVDGPDGVLEPFLVQCDMESVKKMGITIIPIDGNPDITFTESKTEPIEYKVPIERVLALIRGSVYCKQDIEYDCQGPQSVSFTAGEDDSDPGYSIGGIPEVPNSCGCGVTGMCEDPSAKCNCLIDDGETRFDLGVQDDKTNLPVRSVTVTQNGNQVGTIRLGELKCTNEEFDIPANCEAARAQGLNRTYSIKIDPDGAVTNGVGRKNRNWRKNAPPFIAQCEILQVPPMGITIVPTETDGNFEFGGDNLNMEINYRYVTVPQLEALTSKAQFCTQHLKLTCDDFLLHPSNSSYNAFWTATGSGKKNFYFSGNGTHLNCVGPGGVDECQCDSSAGTVKIDEGDLSNKNKLPVAGFDFTRAANYNPAGGSVNAELGYLKCFNVYPTCESYYNAAKRQVAFGGTLPETGAITIDPDTGGPVQAFQVECKFPMTEIPTEPSGGTVEATPDGPTTECFDIEYKDGSGEPLSPDQVAALVDAANGNCWQDLTLTCSNAPITGMIYYESCNEPGVRQPGWAGSAGDNKCACGVTGTCDGGLSKSCNCDNEDNLERRDGGRIAQEDRLPVCKVCITLNGTNSDPSNPVPSRSASFEISNLVCSNKKNGVYRNCQDSFLNNQGSGIIQQDSSIGPIPIYCGVSRSPPYGQLIVYPENPNVTVPANEPADFTFTYFVFNFTILKEMIDNAEYCEQEIRIFCDDGSLIIGGIHGWYGRNDTVQPYWAEPQDGSEPCTADGGNCNCAADGGLGGLIIDQSELPITKIILPTADYARVIEVGPLNCPNIKKDCYDILIDGDKRTFNTKDKKYTIDPDGAGGVDPFEVQCQFDDKNGNAATKVLLSSNYTGRVTGQDGSLPFEIPITYEDATPEQIQALASQSEFCLQGIKYECRQSPVGTLTTADGTVIQGIPAGDEITKMGCPCGQLGTCGTEFDCYCNNLGPMGEMDSGAITEKEFVPLVSATVENQPSGDSVGIVVPSDVKCSNRPMDLPLNCEEAHEQGQMTGEVLIYPSEDIPPFYVYCNMDLIPGKGVFIAKPNLDKDTPVEGPDPVNVTYKGLTPEQLKAAISVYTNCYQPVLVDCYQTGFIKDGAFEWTSLDGQSLTYWGSGSPSNNECTCGAERKCGGDGGRDDMIQRKCNCDIGDGVWRKDGGVLKVTKDLPVMSFTFTTPGSNGAQANMTLGDLYCTNEDLDLPICQMEFDDCHELAECDDRRDSRFKCRCREGYESLVNGKGINELWGNGRECQDDDECSYNICPFAECENLPGDFNCTCWDGFVKVNKTICEDINECEHDEDNDCDPNARCENTPGSFVCKCNRGFVGDGKTCEPLGICSCFGDPHCVSFDSKWLHYQGMCEYVMSRGDCAEDTPSYEIIMKDWNRDLPGVDAAWVQSIIVKVAGMEIFMGQGRELRLNNQLSAGFSQNGITVVDTGREVILTTDKEVANVDLTVIWNGKDKVTLYVPKEHKGKSCGICGNFNDDPTDDWTLGPRCPPGEGPPVTTNNNQFGNSWALPSCDVDCDEEPSRTDECMMSMAMAQQMCSMLLSPAFSPFRTCLNTMEDQGSAILEGLVGACVEDMCRSPNTNMINLCAVGVTLAAECYLIDEPVPVWRNSGSLKCDEECGENMVYSRCGGKAGITPGPIDTCLQALMGVAPTPSEQCLEGCFCEENFYRDGDLCIPLEDCGCLFMEDGVTNYVKPGGRVVEDGCGKYMTCSNNQAFVNTSLVCDDNAECELDPDSGIYGCHCVVGYMGDGETCEVDKCAGVDCDTNQECKDGECYCQMGYQDDCVQCVDIDECATTIHNCTKNGQNCRNIEGGYQCTCDEGFIGTEDYCLDINECDTELNNCGNNAECINIPGSFGCACCGGYKLVNGNCVDDGSGLANIGDENKCCACEILPCFNNNQPVCGSDGNTYASEKELIIKACKLNQEGELIKSYDGECVEDCSTITCDRPNAYCEMVDGVAVCKCPQCSGGEEEIVDESVCTSINYKFKSMCEFEEYSCGAANSEIEITSTGKECDGTGMGNPMADWGPWTDCSTTCGPGYQSRTRYTADDIRDSNGDRLKETQMKICHNTCEDGPCTPERCTNGSVCVMNATTNEVTGCECPDCTNYQEEPVCGLVGDTYHTYINFCLFQRDACMQQKPFYLLQDFACEVSVPLNCSRSYAFGTRREGNCVTEYRDWGRCAGGCGNEPTKCCKEITEVKAHRLYCPGRRRTTMLLDTVIGCECQNKEGETESTTPLLL